MLAMIIAALALFGWPIGAVLYGWHLRRTGQATKPTADYFGDDARMP